jgi:hypothetical protein
MSLEVVFDTEAEAEAQQAIDLQIHFTTNTCPIYQSQTSRWDTPRQRIDGKWAYYTHPLQDYTGMTVEAYNPENYA